MNTISIDYVNGFCGAGKTYANAKYAKEQYDRGQKVLLVQPTTQLIEQTVATTFKDCGLTTDCYVSINSKTTDHVVKVITEFVKTVKSPIILVITHAAFFSIPHFHNRQDWIVIIDEIPQVDVAHELNIPDTHHLLTDHIEIVDKSKTKYHLISEKIGSTGLSDLSKNRNDDIVYAQFKKFVDHVLSPSWDVYVLADHYGTLVNEIDVDGINRKLMAFGIMSPITLAGFKKVVITAACFTESVLYYLWRNWKDDGINVVFNDITGQFTLRYEKHDNGALVDIYFAIDRGWSKNIRNTAVELADGSDAVLVDAIIDKAREMFGRDRSAYFANADVIGTPFTNSERLPNTTHGLNNFQNIDHIACIAAFNPSPAHFRFLKEFADVEAEAITTAMTRQGTYQAICRTSIRDINSTTKKKWIVTDQVTAEWLRSMFTGARTHDLGLFEKKIVSGRPRKFSSKDEANESYRRQSNAKEAEIRLRLARHAIASSVDMTTKTMKAGPKAVEAMSVEIDNINHSEIIDRNEFMGTFFVDRMSKIGVPQLSSFDELVSIFEGFLSETFPSKDSSPAYSPAHYVLNDSGTSRGIANIAYARNIVLDIDSGTMTPDFFAATFPMWKMMIHSSWSHSVAKPKYRVVISTSSVVDVTGYSVITSHILDILRDAGFYGEAEIEAKPGIAKRKTYKGVHGIDRTKLTPACILFVPSSGANPADRFFTVYGGDREPLDVVAVLEEAAVTPVIAPVAPVVPSAPVLPVSSSPAVNAIRQALMTTTAASAAAAKAVKISKALTAWGHVDAPGRRDTGLFVFASSLARAGCDRNELSQHLADAVSSSTARGKSRKDLRNKVDSLIRKFGR